MTKVLRCQALRVEQDAGQALYLFSLTGKQVLSIAAVPRIDRGRSGRLLGYQRPEVRRHISDIVEYLESGQVLFPNSLVLALSSETRFIPAKKSDKGRVIAGVLEIPEPTSRRRMPAAIVDGQQRTLALARSGRDDLLVPVNAFISDSTAVRREQFLRMNSTQPLPRGLVTELVPQVESVLPPRLADRRIPSALCDILNTDPASPFLGMIRRGSYAVAVRRAAVVADTVMVRMLQDSVTSPSGCLFPHCNLATGRADYRTLTETLNLYWRAVRRTFPDAWGLPPARSRLMHGVGIRSMGRVMDRVMPSVDLGAYRAEQQVAEQLQPLRHLCRWTDGHWTALGGMAWNELQNVPSHIRALSSYLVRAHSDALAS